MLIIATSRPGPRLLPAVLVSLLVACGGGNGSSDDTAVEGDAPDDTVAGDTIPESDTGPDAVGDTTLDPAVEDVAGEPDALEDPDAATDVEVDGPTGTASDRVLFIGNSYTNVNSLHVLVSDLLVEAGHDGYTVARAPGGYRLDEHADDADGTNGDTELRQLLVTGPEAALGWDVVVLQQQSQVPGFSHTDPYWMSMVEGATILRDLAADAGADTTFFMTWGYAFGDALNPTLYPDYLTMQERISQGYTDMADILGETGELPWIAPVGLAWEAVHDAGVSEDFESLYSADWSHPSILGSYLAACVIFATLTGTSPVGLTASPAEIDAADRLWLQEIAESVVLDPGAPENWTR